jgi:hypothetical protein
MPASDSRSGHFGFGGAGNRRLIENVRLEALKISVCAWSPVEVADPAGDSI